MLLQFKANNFKSIKEPIMLSMQTASKDEKNYSDVGKYQLLSTAVLYGPNASGKSNILSAIKYMRDLVLNRTKVMQSTDTLPYDPFRLSTETESSSSSFEIIFFVDEIKYRYGFELDETTIFSEWLFTDENGRESKLFYRDVDEDDYVNKDTFKEGFLFFDKENKKIKISKNRLFLWKCDEDEGFISQLILHWFNSFNSLDGMRNSKYLKYTMNQLNNDDFREDITSLVKTADIGIESMESDEEEYSEKILSMFSEKVREKQSSTRTFIKTHHKKFDKDNNELKNVVFELNKEESQGTQKFFAMSAPILDTLKKGTLLIIDELDASLHPMLTKHLVKLFHNKNINKYNAQLIFATHDINLLKKSLFRRDQIWFADKNEYGATQLYSLAQYNNVRKDEDFGKLYLQGKYGAVPYLEDFDFGED